MDEEYISIPNSEIVLNVRATNPGTADMLNVNLEVAQNFLFWEVIEVPYDKIQKGTGFRDIGIFYPDNIRNSTKYDIYINVSDLM